MNHSNPPTLQPSNPPTLQPSNPPDPWSPPHPQDLAPPTVDTLPGPKALHAKESLGPSKPLQFWPGFCREAGLTNCAVFVWRFLTHTPSESHWKIRGFFVFDWRFWIAGMFWVQIVFKEKFQESNYTLPTNETLAENNRWEIKTLVKPSPCRVPVFHAGQTILQALLRLVGPVSKKHWSSEIGDMWLVVNLLSFYGIRNSELVDDHPWSLFQFRNKKTSKTRRKIRVEELKLLWISTNLGTPSRPH